MDAHELNRQVDNHPCEVAHNVIDERRLKGLPVASGVCRGIALFLSAADLEISQIQIDAHSVKSEIQRLRRAATVVDHQLATLTDELEDETLEEAARFLGVHRTILQDPTLISSTENLIREKLVNAEWALSLRLEEIRREFEQIDDDYLRERIDDVAYVFQRLQRVLVGQKSAKSDLSEEVINDPIILVTESLDPADMLQLREREDLDIVGIVMSEGSVTSHAAILARSFDIPTLVGVTGVQAYVKTGDDIMIDADAGELVTRLTPEEQARASESMKQARIRQRELQQLKTEPAVTQDGTKVSLLINIALPEDAKISKKVGAGGVGLFRTEFLFLNRPDLPTEDEQVEAYRKVFKTLKNLPVTIRTADLGGDKMLSKEAFSCLTNETVVEENPALGLRALRFSFAYPRLFVTQLRAILRAAPQGNVRILLPMVTCPEDVQQAKAYLEQAHRELTEEGIRHTTAVQIGGMVEVPAAVSMLGDLIPHLDFFSIGTNDLVQYTLAVDRANAQVSRYYNELHPAVLRVIANAIKRILAADKEVSVCGEMGGRPDLAAFFVGLGCRSLSMDASHIPLVKERIRALQDDPAEHFATSLIRRKSVQSIQEYIQEFEHNVATAYMAKNVMLSVKASK